jgi:hypothetical protein
MLQRKAVEPATLELLKKLMAFEPLRDFNLVGGTALALQLGHRKSVDIDLFGLVEFDSQEMLNTLNKQFTCTARQTFKNTLLCEVDRIKTDILRYQYPPIDEVIIEDGIRMLTMKDIAPMKLAALSQRGARKDYFDIYFLLGHFSLSEMLDFYKQKFNQTEVSHVVRSLTYFTEAEDSDQPEMIKPVTWKEVKLFISKQVNDYLKGK